MRRMIVRSCVIAVRNLAGGCGRTGVISAGGGGAEPLRDRRGRVTVVLW